MYSAQQGPRYVELRCLVYVDSLSCAVGPADRPWKRADRAHGAPGRGAVFPSSLGHPPMAAGRSLAVRSREARSADRGAVAAGTETGPGSGSSRNEVAVGCAPLFGVWLLASWLGDAWTWSLLGHVLLDAVKSTLSSG